LLHDKTAVPVAFFDRSLKGSDATAGDAEDVKEAIP